MNAFICFFIKLFGLLRYTWRSFKLLQTVRLEQQFSQPETNAQTRELGDETHPAEPEPSEAFYNYFMAQTRLTREDKRASMRSGRFGVGEDEMKNLNKEQRQTMMKLKYKMWKQSELQLCAQYFIVVAVLSSIEPWEFIMGWVPFYYVGKMALLVYLLFPQLKGGEIIYFEVLLPRMADERVEKVIDYQLLRLYNASNTAIATVSAPVSAMKSLGNLIYRGFVRLQEWVAHLSALIYRKTVTEPLQAVSNFFGGIYRGVTGFGSNVKRRVSNFFGAIFSVVFFWRKKIPVVAVAEEDSDSLALDIEDEMAADEAAAVLEGVTIEEIPLAPAEPPTDTSRASDRRSRKSTSSRFRRSKRLLVKLAGIEPV